MKRTLYLKACFAFVIVLFLAGCGGGGGGSDSVELVSISVTPGDPYVPNGLTIQFSATGTFTDGHTADITNNVIWSSDTTSVVTIDSKGLATGVSLGAATITATSGEIEDNSLLTTTDAILQSISISPVAPYTGIDLEEPLTVTGTFSDGKSTAELTNEVIWTSTSPDIASIHATTGIVTGVRLGETLINASYDNHQSNTTFTVTDNPWSTAKRMSVKKNYFSSTLLADGKVLVAGGMDESLGFSNAELYDPSTDTWLAVDSMDIARWSHTSTLLLSGKVLVVGGYDGTSALDSAEIYDPKTNTWSVASSMTTAREGSFTATLLTNGKVLVVGGSSAGESLTSAELYDPTTDTWSTVGSMNAGRNDHTATLLSNGKVLVTGGVDTNDANLILASTELYDPASETWSVTSSMSEKRYGHTATLLNDGQLIVVGGHGGKAIFHDSTEIYDPITDIWSMAPSLSMARSDHSAILLNDGRVLLVAGANQLGYIEESELYYPAPNSWISAGGISLGHQFPSTIYLDSGKVLVIGAPGYGTRSTNVEISWQW